jgi:carbonic anhydrase
MKPQKNSKDKSFVAPTPWSGQRPGALVVCCSDGRWHSQVEEFIQTFVSDRPDLYVVPGGPAGLTVWSSSFDEAHVAEKSFRFLAEQHQLHTVWLIAHADCAYYRTKYHPHNPTFIVRRQAEDLRRSAETLTRWYPHIAVHEIFAWRDENRVLFTPLSEIVLTKLVPAALDAPGSADR